MGRIFLLSLELPYNLFGAGYVAWGLRQKDRDLYNSRKIFRSWGKKVIEDRVEEIKKKI